MDELNYHHLLYFWHVAREGSVTKAAERLGVSQPTVSGQLTALEKSIGKPLFTRVGRGLVLSDTGRLMAEYADDIFRLGTELSQALASGRSKPGRLVVGVVDAVPKLHVYRLFAPVFDSSDPVRLVMLENKPDRLAAELAQNALDVIVTDAPISPTIRIRAYHHALGGCGTTIFAAPPLATQLKVGFPGSLSDAPFLVPTTDAALRRHLDAWFSANQITPAIRGEFADSALINMFGGNGVGAYSAPSAVENDIIERYDVAVVGRMPDLRQEFYAVTAARRVTNPVIGDVLANARDRLFAEVPA
jgi:LysR family transcriptional activator of nhaA